MTTEMPGIAASKPTDARAVLRPHLPIWCLLRARTAPNRPLSVTNKPNRHRRPERSAAQSNGSDPLVQNKPNLTVSQITISHYSKYVYKKNRPGGLGQKQTQSNPIGQAILSEAQRSRMDLTAVLLVADEVALSVVERGSQTDLPLALSSSVQNKANFRPFWLKNEDRTRKQTQSKPISLVPRALRVRRTADPAGPTRLPSPPPSATMAALTGNPGRFGRSV
jgi:hypothetical protein